MSVKVIDILKEVSQRSSLELTSNLLNGETAKTYLLRLFNFYHKDFNKRFNWPWRLKFFQIQTVPNYTAGQVTVTTGSRNVVGVGTAFTADMVGRFLKLDSDTEVYEVLAVSNGTTLVLSQPYIGTGSTGTYLIWKKFYDLPPDVPYASELRISQWPYNTDEIPRKNFDSLFLRAYTNGYPEGWSWFGTNRAISTYIAGTVSTTLDSRIVTGTTTAFIGNLFPGSKITIVTNTYTIESVDSDTQITLTQNALATVSASTYSGQTKNRSRISISAVPNPAININVAYYKRVYDLASDTDELDMWEGNEHVLINVMHGHVLEKLTSDKAFSWLTIYEQNIRQAWSNINESEGMEQAIRSRSRALGGYRRTLYGDY